MFKSFLFLNNKTINQLDKNNIDNLVGIPFSKNDWVIDKSNPAYHGKFTGEYYRAGPHMMIQLVYPDGSIRFRPLEYLMKMREDRIRTIEDKISEGYIGKKKDLQRLFVHEKLKGTLHAIFYSMEAAQIEFYPYQFKPVLKFINSPTERLIIADEVGLGKTIEAALIWMELQARKQAKRLLVVCPKTLCEKWRSELRSKFLLDARVADFNELRAEIEELKKYGPGYSFVIISTYTALRPPKEELNHLTEPLDKQKVCSPKTDFLRQVYNWDLNYEPFDLVIFDEAHYMRNPGTTNFHLGECLSENAGAVLLISATPVNNKNTDLHSLLRLADKDFFETQTLFEELLEANRPSVQAMNALSRIPVDIDLLKTSVDAISRSRFIKDSPLFELFKNLVDNIDINNKTQILNCQSIAEKLNLLGSYINRTRRVHVKEHSPLREPYVLCIEFNSYEKQLYDKILKLVRYKCKLDKRPFHVFQVMGLQLRAASSLPVIAEEIRNRRFGEAQLLFEEVFDNELVEDGEIEEINFTERIETSELNNLLDFDFEKHDTKYNELRKYLIEELNDEKVVIFAYYRPTISYLKKRLEKDMINVAVIHGGMSNQKRWEEIECFKNPDGPQVLLSSEVGSEGIDLQFCRIIVNYDMPWNPMRIEQRIGRIDRIGQKAKKLTIINFKVKDTIEEKVYEKLHEKLFLFANSLGDLESIIGKEVQKLSVQLLSQELTHEQEKVLIEQTERAIEERLKQIRDLEEEGETLIALSDYVQTKIEEDKEKGRYIQPKELEYYLLDFFEREFRGCKIFHNKPFKDCFEIKLTNEAFSSLSEFIKNDRSIQALPFRQREFLITFRNDLIQGLPLPYRKTVNYVNHLSPLIKWITKINLNRAYTFYNVSAVELINNNLSPGDYCYRIERWKFKGLSVKESLEYGVMSLNYKKIFPPDVSEDIIQDLIHNGKDLENEIFDKNAFLSSLKELEGNFRDRFSLACEEFEKENITKYQIKKERVKSFFNRRISQDEQRIKTLKDKDTDKDKRMIKLAEGRLKAAKNNLKQRLDELEAKKTIDMEHSEVAVGLIRIIK